MTITTRPYDGSGLSGDSGPYSSAQWRKTWFDLLGKRGSATNNAGNLGVLYGVLNELRVDANSPAAMNVKVKSGAACIQGMWLENDADVTVTVPSNSTGSTRYDIIYAQYDATTRLGSINIAVGTTVLPTLTQSLGGTYQIPLAYLAVPNGATSITAAMIFDYRGWANMPETVGTLVQNVSGGALDHGDVVVWSTSTSRGVTTSSTALNHVAGVVEGYIPNNGWGRIITKGVHRVNIGGNTVARGDVLSQSTSVKVAAALNALTSFAVAVEPSSAVVNGRILAEINALPFPRIMTAQGDLIVLNSANQHVRRARPTNGFPLIGDSSQATGYKDGGQLKTSIVRMGTKLTLTGDLAITAGVATDITWQNEVYDSNTFIAVPAVSITIPSGLGGLYLVLGNLDIGSGSGGSLLMELKVNGVVVLNLRGVTTATRATAFFSVPLVMSAADALKVTVTITGGATHTLYSGTANTFFAIEYLGT